MLLAVKGRKGCNAELDNNHVTLAAQYFCCGTNKNAETTANPTLFGSIICTAHLGFAAHRMCLFGMFGTVHGTKTREHLCKLQRLCGG